MAVPAGDGRLFVKSGADQSTMLRVRVGAESGYAIEPLWTAPVLRTTYVIPVYNDGHLYGMNGRTVFTCVDAATGEQAGVRGSRARGSRCWWATTSLC